MSLFTGRSETTRAPAFADPPREAIDGWLSYGSSRDPDSESSTAEVYGLHVAPDAWRSGVGTALWANARQRPVQNRFRQVTLRVLATNVRARCFYDTIGFHHDMGATKPFSRGDFTIERVRYRIDPANPQHG